jgi:hypothetical protein
VTFRLAASYVLVLGALEGVVVAQPIWSGPFVRSWALDGTPSFPVARAFGSGGDLNQDGYHDIVFGNEVAYCGHGAIAAFRGLDGFPLWQAIGGPGGPSCPQPPVGCEQTTLGHKRIVLVDLDGDQNPDALTAAWGKCHAQWLYGPNTYGGLGGSVFGFRGSDGGILFEVSAPWISWSSPQGTGGYGWSFDGGFDLTGDGATDVVASAYVFGLPGEPILRGAVFGMSQNGSVPFAVFPGLFMGDQPGGTPSGDGAVEFLDDIDGDGVTDFLVSSSAFYLGAPYPSPSFVPSVGIVRLHSGANFQVLQSVQGAGANQGFGYYMGTLPDVNGDGIRDFFGSVRAHTTYSIFPVPPFTDQRIDVRSGADFSLIRTIYFVEGTLAAQNPYEREIGPSVADDVDGDGLPEVVLPSCGWQNCLIRVVSLSTGIPVHQWVFPYTPFATWMGAGGGDLNGDGLSDVVLVNPSENGGGVAAPFYGHAEVWLSQNTKLVTRPVLGNQAVFAVHMPRWPNRPFRLLFSQATTPPVLVGPYVIPLALDPMFMASLWNWFGGVLNGSGKGSVSVPIPNVPSLSGMTFYASGIAVDSASPYGIAAVLTAVKIDIP